MHVLRSFARGTGAGHAAHDAILRAIEEFGALALFQDLRGSQTVVPEGGVVNGMPGSVQIDFQGSASVPLIPAPAGATHPAEVTERRLNAELFSLPLVRAE